MKKIPKDKRNKLIGVALATIGVIFGLWFFLISAQRTTLKGISEKIESVEQNQKRVRSAVNNAAQIEVDLKLESQALADIENEMASGDFYMWQINTIKRFKAAYPQVEIPELTQGPAADCSLLPKFPYRQVTLSVGGTAFFNDFGKFLADLENTFPYTRVLNLQLWPGSSLSASDKEKLYFKMEIVTLIKPGQS